MSRPTLRQTQYLAAIASGIKVKGYPPTVRELLGFFGSKSTNTVATMIKALRRRGLLQPGGMRSHGRPFVITPAGWRLLGIPDPRIHPKPQPVAGGTVWGEKRCGRCGAAFFGDVCPCPRPGGV